MRGALHHIDQAYALASPAQQEEVLRRRRNIARRLSTLITQAERLQMWQGYYRITSYVPRLTDSFRNGEIIQAEDVRLKIEEDPVAAREIEAAMAKHGLILRQGGAFINVADAAVSDEKFRKAALRFNSHQAATSDTVVELDHALERIAQRILPPEVETQIRAARRLVSGEAVFAGVP